MSNNTITAAAYTRTISSLPTGCYHIRLVSREGETLEILRDSHRGFAEILRDNQIFPGTVGGGFSSDQYASDEVVAGFEVERVDLLCNVWE